MKKLPQGEKAVMQSIGILPQDLERIKAYAQRHNFRARGKVSITKAIRHIFNNFDWEKGVEK